jgi:hypothetical protein
MYQVTAIWQGSEIGYGEGEGLEYAKEDCMQSLDLIFDAVLDEIEYLVIHSEI